MFSLLKKQLFILGICLLTQAYANDVSFNERVQILEEKCFDGEEVLPDNYVEVLNTSCLKLALEIDDEVKDAEEEQASGVEEGVTGEMTCSGEDVLQTSEIERLKILAAGAAAQVKCLPAEIEKNKAGCENVWTCNSYRSINAAADTLLPKIISKKINSSLENKVTESNLPIDCLDKNEGNCLTEVTTAFLSSFWSTMTSVWDLVKTGSSYLLSPSKWFDSKSDELHAMSEKTDKDVSKLTSDPAAYFSDLMNSMKKNIDSWVRSSVLCQEWSGAPHMSDCKVPLSSYECIDCNDKINATCAAIGAITSEFGVMVFTAGAGNMISLGAKVGARALSRVSAKVANKIKQVSPSMKSPAVVATMKAEGKVLSSVKKISSVASVVAAKSMEMFKKGKMLSEKIISHVEEYKIVKASLAVGDFISDPLRMSKRMSRLGVNTSNRILASTGSGVVARRSKMALAMDKKYDQKRIVREVIDKRDDHTKRNVAIRGSRTTQKLRSEYQHLSSHGKNQKPSGNTDHIVSESTGRKDYESAGKSGNRSGDSVQIEKKKEHQQSKVAEGQTSSNSGTSHHKKEEHQSNVAGMANLGKAVVATGIAAKAHDILAGKDQPSQKAQKSVEKVTSVDQAKQILGANSVEEMAAKAAALESVYNESTRSEMVDRIASESGVSKEVANSVYEQRVQEINEAKEFVASQGYSDISNSVASNSTSRKEIASKELEKLFGKAKDVQKSKVLEKFEKKKGELESKLAKLSETLDDEAKTVVDDNFSSDIGSRRSPASQSPARARRNSGNSGPAPSVSPTSSSVSSNSSSSNLNSEANDSSNNLAVSNLQVSPDTKIDAKLEEQKTNVENIEKQTFEKVAVTNLLQLINLEGVELENDVSVSLGTNIDLTSEGLAPDYISAFNNFIESNDKAKLRIVKEMEDGKLEVIEDQSGMQYSLLINAGSARLIKNEESRKLLDN